MPILRLASALLVAGVLGFTASAPATVFVTTRLDDAPVDGCATNGCTLREAVIAANGGGGPHRVELGVRGRYELTIPGANENAAATGDLDLLVSMEVGPPPGSAPDAAAYVVDANGLDRVFHARPPSGSSILLRGMTITGGSAALVALDKGGGLFTEAGSGIEVTVRVEDCAIVGNQASYGGGIGSSDTALTVERTTISGNQAVTVGLSGVAGGAFVGLGSARFVRSTIAGNDATGLGGALSWSANALVNLEQTTVAGNSASDGSVLVAPSIEDLHIRDSILSGSCSGFPGGTLAQSGGGNIESPGNSCGLGPADQVGISGAALGLGALASQGGSTPTMALGASSAARNRVPAARCAPFDQRGFQRLAPYDAACDAGAYEAIGFCRTPNLAIPDNSPDGIGDALILTDSFLVHDLDLWARVDHTWVGDLKLQLTYFGLEGATSVLLDRPGFPAVGTGCGDDNLRLKLDDAASTPVESGCSNTQVAGAPAYAVSTARPGDPPGNLLASFAGLPMGADWTLQVMDLAAQDTGTLVEWCLLPNGDLFSDGFESGTVGAWSVAVPPGLPQLGNANFDLGHQIWAENSVFFPGELVVEEGLGGAPAAHTPPWLAWLGGVLSEVGEISQRIAVPAGSGPAYLHLRYQLSSDETNCSQATPSDSLTLRVNGVQVAGFVVCSTFNTGAVWTPYGFVTNFAAYAGQTIDVTIRMTNDGVLPSSVYVDSVTFESTPPTVGSESALRRFPTEATGTAD
jgi:CSLREA domain-containing protein